MFYIRSVTSSIKPWLKVKAKEMNHKPSDVYYDLTKDGRKLAEKHIRAHKLTERLLTDIIGIDWIRAHEIAHRLELFIM
jgi:DtxR family Mn-dependent transcriptional regulator